METWDRLALHLCGEVGNLNEYLSYKGPPKRVWYLNPTPGYPAQSIRARRRSPHNIWT